ncbi:MAG: helix-turn-helix domain-containing protein [Pseudomonadota bacterium]
MSIAKKLMETLGKDINPSKTKVSDSYIHLVELFPLQVITTKTQHLAALKVIQKLISFIADGKVQDEGIRVYLQTLSELVGDYEKKTFNTTAVSGKEMLTYLMELQGLTQKDLAQELGGQPIVSKILSGERELNLRQIKALAKRFKVSPEVFI